MKTEMRSFGIRIWEEKSESKLGRFEVIMDPL